MSHCLKNGQRFAYVGDFLFKHQDQRVFEIRSHVVLVVDEIGRQVTTVELHAFNHRQFIFQTAAIFYSDNTFLTDLFHGFSNDVTDSTVTVGGNAAHLGNGLAAFTDRKNKRVIAGNPH